MPMDEDRPRLVLLGAGYANLQVMKLLADSKLFESVTLVDVQPQATYCGLIPCSLAKLEASSSTNETTIDLQNQCYLLNIHFVNDGVVDIDVNQRIIYLTETQETLPYDLLSLDIGTASKALDAVPGAFDFAIPIRPMHELRGRLEQAEEQMGNDEAEEVRLVVVGGGALAIELALCMESRWRPLLGDRLHVVLVVSESTLLPERTSARRVLKQILLENHITMCFHAKVVEVQENRLCLESGMLVRFSYCLWATGDECHDLAWTLKQRGLDVTDEGWIQVGESLQSTSHPNIFAAGDCCASESLTLPKAGGIHTLQEGPVLAHNLEHFALHEKLETLEISASKSGSMQFISCGDGTALGFAFGIPLRGQWVWEIKNAMNHEFFALIKGDGHANSASSSVKSYRVPSPMAGAALLHGINIDNYRMAWATLEHMTSNETYRSEVLKCYAQLTGCASENNDAESDAQQYVDKEEEFTALRAPQSAAL